MKKKDKKPQKETIKFWQEEKALSEKKDEELGKLPQDIQELFDKAYKAKRDYLDSVQKERDQLRVYVRQCEKKIQELKSSKAIAIPADVEKWFDKYLSGVNFGYAEPKIVYLSDNKEFVIIRSSGGTAGTGTAMGTGGYYYAKTEHWISKVGGPRYTDWNNGKGNKACDFYGRLGKKEKELMLQYIKECISGERDFYTDNGSLVKVYPEAFTPEEIAQSESWR